jgi:radical SAM/Cys-rich protein
MCPDGKPDTFDPIKRGQPMGACAQALDSSSGAGFDAALSRHGLAPLARSAPQTLQVNLGKRCNQACHHCHVDAGPNRTENMTRATADRVVELTAASGGIDTVDLTGGAPELNPNFKFLVESSRALGRAVIVRCNLTILFVPGMEGLAHFYRENRVHLICSLPCYSESNVDQQRGRNVFKQSIEALQILNRIGYAREGLTLDLVYNPVGPALPPPQAELETTYRAQLRANFNLHFNRLLTITNMPIHRFADQLHRLGRFDDYLGMLVNHFNPATIPGLMCRSLVSVGWDGMLYDCDFNQMLELPIGADTHRPPTIWEVRDLATFAGARVATAAHCFGCTAGAGSSCGGALAS